MWVSSTLSEAVRGRVEAGGGPVPAADSEPAREPVRIVGAGPGAPDLITVRGQRFLKHADLVVWAGSLVNPELLALCPAGCIRLDSSRMTLAEIVDAMVEGWQAGKRVVRLHTGDPSLYGAIREQMDALAARGVPFEVVPGVSSLSAAAAALTCEYTVPGISQAVIIARAEGRTGVPEGQGLAQLAAHGATMAVFLSAALADQVSSQVMAGGMAADTPAAIVYRASWPDQRTVRCTVGTLGQAAREAGIDRQALLVIGQVVGTGVGYQPSRLYDASFTTGCRQAVGDGAAAEGGA